MNIEQWLSLFADAHQSVSGNWPLELQQLSIKLLSEMPTDDTDDGCCNKYGFQDTIEKATLILTKYFFMKVVRGETFCPIDRVKKRFGRSLESNYEVNDGPFLQMAKAYWTFKMEVDEIFHLSNTPEQSDVHPLLVLSHVLRRVERIIGSLFFPFPGQHIWVRKRRIDQKEFLKEIVPDFPIEIFLNSNPFLGTSQSNIAKAVYSEKVWVVCPIATCSKYQLIPNTVKRLKIKCARCKKTFIFPASDIEWLDHLEPHIHPAPEKIEELEKLRLTWDIPHKIFSQMGIYGTAWATERVLRYLYAKTKHETSDIPEKKMFELILKSRSTESLGEAGLQLDENKVDKALASINSIEDLVQYVLEQEQEEPYWEGPVGLREKIENILKS